MVPPSFSLPPQQLAEIFPFHLVFNRHKEIVQIGEVLQRSCPGLSVGSQIEEHFRFNRPTVAVEFDAIRKQSHALFLLECVHNGMQLKGQIVYVEESDVIFFLGSLWVTDIADLKPLKIKLKDFAIHDPIGDFLFLLQAQNTVVSDAKKLANQLTQQQSELQEALKVKEELAATAQAQSLKLEQTLVKLREAQIQLIQAEKMSSLGQLVAGVAHEINNPVSFIYSNLNPAKEYTQYLLELIRLYQKFYPNPAGEIQKHSEDIDLNFIIEDMPKVLESMNNGADRIRQIVLSLRNFARLDESGMKRVNIHEGINSALLILQHRLKSKEEHPDIEIVKEFGVLPPVECDAGQLNQVFINLIANAIDAFKESAASGKIIDAPRITIRTEAAHPYYVMVRIADNGLGMIEEMKKRIFNPFFTTKSGGKKTGLGLSISYHIVQKHKGILRCVSSPGKGTEFWIKIPVRQHLGMSAG